MEAPARKSHLFNTGVVREVHYLQMASTVIQSMGFRARSASKGATVLAQVAYAQQGSLHNCVGTRMFSLRVPLINCKAFTLIKRRAFSAIELPDYGPGLGCRPTTKRPNTSFKAVLATASTRQEKHDQCLCLGRVSGSPPN